MCKLNPHLIWRKTTWLEQVLLCLLCSLEPTNWRQRRRRSRTLFKMTMSCFFKCKKTKQKNNNIILKQGWEMYCTSLCKYFFSLLIFSSFLQLMYLYCNDMKRKKEKKKQGWQNQLIVTFKSVKRCKLYVDKWPTNKSHACHILKSILYKTKVKTTELISSRFTQPPKNRTT